MLIVSTVQLASIVQCTNKTLFQSKLVFHQMQQDVHQIYMQHDESIQSTGSSCNERTYSLCFCNRPSVAIITQQYSVILRLVKLHSTVHRDRFDSATKVFALVPGAVLTAIHKPYSENMRH